MLKQKEVRKEAGEPTGSNLQIWDQLRRDQTLKANVRGQWGNKLIEVFAVRHWREHKERQSLINRWDNWIIDNLLKQCPN